MQFYFYRIETDLILTNKVLFKIKGEVSVEKKDKDSQRPLLIAPCLEGIRFEYK